MQQDSKKRIMVFLLLTLGIYAIPNYIIISTGAITTVTGLLAMWSPGIAAILTQLFFRKSLLDFGWGWGKTRYRFWSIALPFLYVLAVHLFVWGAGIGGFTTVPAISSIQTLTLGGIMACIAALGEEIGWSGFFVPELAKITSFTKTALIRGIVWSVWHYPIIISGLYAPDVAKEVPLWYQLICFTLILTSISFAFTWFRLKSGSLWTGMFLHASHNKFIQGVFSKLTTDEGVTLYFIGEFGAATTVVALLVAYIFWKKRHQLEPCNRSLYGKPQLLVGSCL